MTQLFLPMRPILFRAIDTLEGFYAQGLESWNVAGNMDDNRLIHAANVHLEILELIESQGFATSSAIARLLWETAVVKKESSVWFIRNSTPEAAILFMLCSAARVPLEKLMKADLTEPHFRSLTLNVAQLPQRPLKLCRAPNLGSFKKAIKAARARYRAKNAFCDWILSPEEILAAQISGLRVIAPAHHPEQG